MMDLMIIEETTCHKNRCLHLVALREGSILRIGPNQGAPHDRTDACCRRDILPAGHSPGSNSWATTGGRRGGPPKPDIVLLRNENTGELMMALMLRENIGPRTQAMMIEGDGVYRIQEPGGRSYFGLLRGTRMEGTWECKCVGTGGIPGICPQLTDCPPVDCKNDSTTGHANCTWVKVIPPS
jgi:hypothetical protein